MTGRGSEATGRCLCGGVRFAVSLKAPEIGACHCSMCRRWTGGPFLAVEAAAAPSITAGDDLLGVYRSSEWGERCFCTRCGTSLFWRMLDGRHHAVSAGALDEIDLTLAAQIFIDEKPAYYDFANDTPKLTGDEVAAMFADGGNG